MPKHAVPTIELRRQHQRAVSGFRTPSFLHPNHHLTFTVLSSSQTVSLSFVVVIYSRIVLQIKCEKTWYWARYSAWTNYIHWNDIERSTQPKSITFIETILTAVLSLNQSHSPLILLLISRYSLTHGRYISSGISKCHVIWWPNQSRICCTRWTPLDKCGARRSLSLHLRE